MWYLEPELANKKQVEGILDQIAWWDCKFFFDEHRPRIGISWEMTEALWAEYYS
jgi:hypothetical protein